ncbi:HAD family hydrolase [Salipaludibacillus sp. CF4.18]|uniref:HAD family hydrolase n=1 Tax=Salipaludibacillus sp. CF4.18 TaxID=3373081 RepID=UPI003EE75145
MIKAIFFDLDDTLLWDEKSVKKAFEATCEYAVKDFDVDALTLEEAVRKEARTLYAGFDTYEFTKLIGINPFEGLWGEFTDEGKDFEKMAEMAPDYQKNAWINGLKAVGIDDKSLGIDLAHRFPKERKKFPFLFEDAIETLEKLTKDYKLLMLTNGSPQLQNIKLEITPELVPYFDQVIISGAFGIGKPDKSIFEYALNVMDVKPEEVLMVGDNLMTDILGANRTGIPSVWLNRFEKEATDVKPDYEIKTLHEIFSLLKA